MILSDRSLKALLPTLIQEPDYAMVNPASVDIRIGRRAILESTKGINKGYNLEAFPLVLFPGEFVLVETLEHITIPNGYAVHLFLKSSIARQGYNHSLAFWVDPGWSGVLTMEVQNITKHQVLKLQYGMRFAQIVVEKLDHEAEYPYEGRYQGAQGVETSKS
jgi:dCTP deaminase